MRASSLPRFLASSLPRFLASSLPRWTLSAFVGVGALAWSARDAYAGDMVKRGIAATTSIHYTAFLTTGCHTIETLAPTPSTTDPILYVWGSPSAGAPKQQITYDDDSGAGSMARVNDACVFSPTNVDVIVLAFGPATSGRIDLYIDGVRVLTQEKVGGSDWITGPNCFGPTCTIQYPRDLDVETAFEPGGAKDTRLYAFDATGRMVGQDDDSGVGAQSKLHSPDLFVFPDAYYVWGDLGVSRVTARTAADEGTTSVIYNDYAADSDGDGLGAALENELGTCDAVGYGNCPTWFSGPAAASYDPKDTDRDGIADGYEVFGRELATDPKPQYLPKWGANPVHKDIFIEEDWRYAATNPIDTAFLTIVQAHFSAAPASHILNPDLTDGISLHVDNGISPASPTNTLHGNWGGSNRVFNEDPKHTHVQQFPIELPPLTSARFPFFRYVLIDVGNVAGFAASSSFGIGVQVPVVPSSRSLVDFAHELGHTLTLQHHGDALGSWGMLNCNPLYRSLMNYTEGDLGFSTGANDGTVIDPSNITETGLAPDFNWFVTAGSAPYSYLAVFDSATSTHKVDFDRDGVYANPPGGGQRTVYPWPRGALGCAPHAQKGRALILPGTEAAPVLRPTTVTNAPIMVRAPNKLYVLRSSPSGIAYSWTVRGGPNDNGSCERAGAGSLLIDYAQIACDEFRADAGLVPGTSSIKGFSALYTNDSKVLVAYQDASNTIWSVEGVISTDGAIAWGSATSIATDARSHPELSSVGTAIGPAVSDGIAFFQTVTYVDTTGNYAWRKRSSAGTWGAASTILTDVTAPIAGTGNPSLPATFAQPPLFADSPMGAFPIRTCAIFPSGVNKEAMFYCYNPNTNKWKLQPDALKWAGATLRLRQKAGLVMHYPRTSTGALWPMGTTDVRAQFWATIPQPYDSADYSPYIWTTAAFPFNASSVPEGLAFVPTAPLSDGDIKLGLTTLFETQDATGLRAAYLGETKPDAPAVPEPFVVVLPFVDGGLKANSSDGSDFRVMERGICSMISTLDARCQVKNEWGY